MIILLIIVILASAVGVAWHFIYKYFYYPRKYKDVHYKAVRKVVHEYDYRLINRFTFPIEENKCAVLDHIIFGEKFFYVILNHYYDGELMGNLNDKSFIYLNTKGKKYYVNNPYKLLAYSLSRLSTSCGIDKKYLIGIVLINDSCTYKVEANYESYFVCKRKHLGKLIKSIESRKDIGKIKEEMLQQVIYDMNRINRRKDAK